MTNSKKKSVAALPCHRSGKVYQRPNNEDKLSSVKGAKRAVTECHFFGVSHQASNSGEDEIDKIDMISGMGALSKMGAPILVAEEPIFALTEKSVDNRVTFYS